MDDDAAAVDTNPATTEVAEGDALPATSEAASAAGGDSAGPMDVKQEAGVGEETNDDGEAEMDLSDGEDGEVSERPGPGASGSAYKAPEDVPVKYEYVPVADGTASSVKEPVDSDMASRKRAMPIASKHDRFAKFEARIAADSWDTDAWINLLAEATRRGESSLIQDTYERFLKQFPTSARHWIAYAEYEMGRGDLQRVESIFARCLRPVPDVDLWNCYLTYVRRRYNNDRDANHRTTVQKAFEFVLQNVGLDKDSGSIWADYVTFLKAAPAGSSYEEQQKMDSLRKTYHRALSVPISNIEQLWRDYDAYEHSLSRMTAKKFIADRSATYMLARSGQRELRIIMESLDSARKNWLAKPPTWGEKECQLLMAWKRYIEWERSNPLKLEDKSALANRVAYAYRRSLLMMRMFPELWHEAAAYLNEVSRGEEALAILKQGVEALPTSTLVHLSLADMHEARNGIAPAKQLYESLVTNLEQQITDINQRAEAEKARAIAAVQAHTKGPGMGVMDGEEREERRQKEKAAVDKVEAARAKEVGEAREALALTWVFYMRFARRTENIKAARAVFSRARKSPDCLPHVFVASALMEHYISKDPSVAGRIFELGLKNVPEGNGDLLVAYISEYLDWLISQNDENNTRALFERSLLAVPAEKTRVLWSKFAAYEAQFGDLGSLLRVEKRRAEAFPGDAHTMAGLVNVAERYSYLDLKVVSDRELGIAALEKLEKSMPASRGKSRGSTAVEGKAKEGTLDDKVGKNPLESFHPERYPRPDFGRYAVHKMDASSSAASLPPRPKVEDRLPPSGSTSLPSIPTPSHFAGGRTPTVGISGARSPLGPVPGSTAPGPGMIPELIARLISYLPPAHQYAGPRLPVDDLLAYLNSLPIPPPTQPPIYVPMPVVGAMPTVMSPQGPGYVSPNPYTGAWGAVGAVPKRRNEEDDRGRKRFRG